MLFRTPARHYPFPLSGVNQKWQTKPADFSECAAYEATQFEK